jgi:3,4-dihydroxy 2-butanone 4-phosphate synthase / GTP cyclohydrolase II
MAIVSIKEGVETLKAGKMIILCDDPRRENEGDLVMAAQAVTSEAVNFMITEARGLLCMPMTAVKCAALALPMMVEPENNHSLFATPFTVSIGAARGITTGISADDRAHTIVTAADPQALPTDLSRPGHVFPLRAHTGGVLARAGHTEASVELVQRAGFAPCAVIIEIIRKDGRMARQPDLEIFSQEHAIPIVFISELKKELEQHGN